MYRLKDGTIVNDPQYIMPDMWVEDRVAEKIKEKFSENNREMYVVNMYKKISGETLTEKKLSEIDVFLKYREECIAWGKAQKALYAERRANVISETQE